MLVLIRHEDWKGRMMCSVRSRFLDRCRGAVFGTVAGDCAGVPHEHKKAAEIAADLVLRGGQLYVQDYHDPWAKRRGIEKWVSRPQPSDDSELAAALGISLIAHPEFDPVDAYKELRSFMMGRVSILTFGPAYGHGQTLKSALTPETYEASCAAFDAGSVRLLPTNGSLMRNIAVPLACHGNFGKLVHLSRRQSLLTHRHPLCVASCIAHSVFVSEILDGKNPDDAWEETGRLLDPLCATFEGLNEVLSLDPSEPSEDEIWPHAGEVTLSLRVALWATITADSFEDGIMKTIRIGGDTDTYAAIAGGPLGAHFGFEAIPSDWITGLERRQTVEDIAYGLYQINHSDR